MRAAFSQPGQFVIANFNRTALQQQGAGHFSPVAAYSPQADSVLVMDVARYKYPAFWVSVTDLFASMNTVDSSSKMTRGWLTIQHQNTGRAV